jgi:hypothetical protein
VCDRDVKGAPSISVDAFQRGKKKLVPTFENKIKRKNNWLACSAWELAFSREKVCVERKR